MSPIGRIFIVVNLFLAVAFLGWASANLANANKYKDLYEAEQKAKEDLETDLNARISELNTNLTQSQNANQMLNRDKGELVASNQRFETDLNAAQAANTELQASLDVIEERLQTMATAIQGNETRANEAVASMREADDARHAAEDAQAAAEEKVDGLERQLEEQSDAIAALEVKVTDTEKKLADTETALQVLSEVTGTAVESVINQPLISGAVVMVSYEIEPGIVLINRGAADEVMRGHSFEIYSGSQYKGTVRVTNVHENTCSAVIEKAFEGRTIQQGDKASTRI